MSTQIIPQPARPLSRSDRIAGQHAAFDLFFWLYQDRPDLIAEERINRARKEQIVRASQITPEQAVEAW